MGLVLMMGFVPRMCQAPVWALKPDDRKEVTCYRGAPCMLFYPECEYPFGKYIYMVTSMHLMITIQQDRSTKV